MNSISHRGQISQTSKTEFNTTMPRLEYRPDIDGLRAASVIAVIAFHFFPNIAPLGFLGVDIFFVISGYLITKTILNNTRESNFSILDFYKRRARRIFPALILVLGTSSVIGVVILFPQELERFGWLQLSATLFAANFILTQTLPYFNPSQLHTPLLHLWSLGVEEQFYIVWPFMFIAISKARQQKILVWVLTLASLTLFFYLFEKNQNLAFYLPFTRFWELTAGAIIAIHEPQANRILHTKKTVLLALVISALSALILYTENQSENLARETSLIYISVVLFCTLILGSSNSFFHKIFSLPLLVGIGKISFSLYLWHWPALVFARILNSGEEPDLLFRFSILALIFTLSFLTYKYIENPIRENKGRDYTKGLFISMALIFAISAIFIASKGLPFRFERAATFETARTSWQLMPENQERICIIEKASDINRGKCTTKFLNTESLLVWGDSQARNLFPGMAIASSEEDSLILASMPGCNPFLLDSNSSSSECVDLNHSTLNMLLSSPNIKNVFFIFSLNSLNQDGFAKLGLNTISSLIQSGKTVFVYQGNPQILKRDRFYNYYCFQREYYFLSDIEQDKSFCNLSLQAYSAQSERIIDMAKLAGIEAVKIINPSDILCPNGTCSVLLNNKALYSYTDHLSVYGATLVGKFAYSQIHPNKQNVD